MILETTFKSDICVRLTDFMPPKVNGSKIVRIVEGIEGTVRINAQLVVRFDYGVTVPWMSRLLPPSRDRKGHLDRLVSSSVTKNMLQSVFITKATSSPMMARFGRRTVTPCMRRRTQIGCVLLGPDAMG